MIASIAGGGLNGTPFMGMKQQKNELEGHEVGTIQKGDAMIELSDELRQASGRNKSTHILQACYAHGFAWVSWIRDWQKNGGQKNKKPGFGFIFLPPIFLSKRWPA
jgi:hypothetical protein